MKEIFEPWLRQISPDVGILACGIRLPDGAFLTHAFSSDFPMDQWEAVWKRLDETVYAFSLRQLPISRQCWKFDRHHLYWIMRLDGLALGLLISYDALRKHEEYIHLMFQGFLDWHAQAAA